MLSPFGFIYHEGHEEHEGKNESMIAALLGFERLELINVPPLILAPFIFVSLRALRGEYLPIP